MPTIRSEYTPYGLSLYDESSTADYMWRNAPNPRLILPSVGYGLVEDFTNCPIDDTTLRPTNFTWTLVDVGSGTTTAAIKDAAGGRLRIEAAGNEDDGAQGQMVGEIIKLASGKPVWIDFKISLDEATQSDMFVGLSITDTTILASAPSDYIGFRKDDGDANIDFVAIKDTTATNVTAITTISAATDIVLGIYFDGAGTATPYYNGTKGTAITTNIPDDEELRISLAYLNGAAQSAKGLECDYIRVVQIR